jgi:DUF971 family protein
MTSWPTELRLSKDKKILTVTFDSGEKFALPAEYLRIESPSAEVQGHRPEEKQIVTGKQNVAIMDIQPVGNYAVRLVFDDGHDSGLYSWDWLFGLGRDMPEKWSSYLASQGRRG